ncbi:hydroxymethylglutaryl-CoA reductase, degradative [Periweissella cryptocerci]|uniref:3-hydroxy-3-methylglutaryl coenzyme A reductase n=1 Tax=Periweissella cryptocerci TaxID=2506420 RepID=A0A4P6YUP1_9LACO|nr:hydroxymethylglutaryl-CoA reductase, degradative [Periweissella cryptocerci]QBO36433.1 hydroxymethylglutaryl-CoA reductase, degradative [Periweissella cryptocerci]
MKFHQLSWTERLREMVTQGHLSVADQALFTANYDAVNEQMIENYVTSYRLPEGVVPNLVVNGQTYMVPMVTEEPSVIAAAANGARMIGLGSGVKAEILNRQMIGQVLIHDADFELVVDYMQAHQDELVNLGNAAHPSMAARGGGLTDIRVRDLGAGYVSVDLLVDTKAAMGANVVNTMAEAVANDLRKRDLGQVTMAILSNLATESLVKATVAIPFSSLVKGDFSGQQIADQIMIASEFSQRDPYRATTENKGLMNGIDAAVMASGNDWRAIEAGVHAYASHTGQYRGLTTWSITDEHLLGELIIPLPVGIVGGSIGIVPLVKANQRMLAIESAEELAQVIAGVGLAQNLAALRALVTNGIQAGHMALQMKSLAIAVGATTEEIPVVVEKLKHAVHADMQTAQEILDKVRN